MKEFLTGGKGHGHENRKPRMKSENGRKKLAPQIIWSHMEEEKRHHSDRWPTKAPETLREKERKG